MPWIDEHGAVIEDDAAYVDADGVQHLAQRDKATIPGLRRIVPADRPDETPAAWTVTGEARGGVTVTGWHVVEIDGQPVQVWDVLPRPVMTEAEAHARALADLRAERDRRLAASDIMVMPDRWEAYTAEQRAAWTVYRQALRDLPETVDDPAAPDWPTSPEGI